ncbi:MAG: hypothetical protein JKY20_03375, partial [Alphaproteobacteria bacterium]|nr:hypothetical protein [Alphaproteobacteria bacterium]
MTQALEPLDGAWIWTGAKYPDNRSWVRRFDANMLSELEAAGRRMIDSGAAPESITAAAYDLPITSALLDASYNDLENGPGFSMLSGLPVDDWGLELSRAVLCIAGAQYGKITKQNREGEYLLDVVNKDVTHGTQNRGYHSNVLLDFH